MVIERDATFYRNRISQCKMNIRRVNDLGFAPEDKKMMVKSYTKKLREYEVKLASFFNGSQN